MASSLDPAPSATTNGPLVPSAGMENLQGQLQAAESEYQQTQDALANASQDAAAAKAGEARRNEAAFRSIFSQIRSLCASYADQRGADSEIESLLDRNRITINRNAAGIDKKASFCGVSTISGRSTSNIELATSQLHEETLDAEYNAKHLREQKQKDVASAKRKVADLKAKLKFAEAEQSAKGQQANAAAAGQTGTTVPATPEPPKEEQVRKPDTTIKGDDESIVWRVFKGIGTYTVAFFVTVGSLFVDAYRAVVGLFSGDEDAQTKLKPSVCAPNAANFNRAVQAMPKDVYVDAKNRMVIFVAKERGKQTLLGNDNYFWGDPNASDKGALQLDMQEKGPSRLGGKNPKTRVQTASGITFEITGDKLSVIDPRNKDELRGKKNPALVLTKQKLKDAASEYTFRPLPGEGAPLFLVEIEDGARVYFDRLYQNGKVRCLWFDPGEEPMEIFVSASPELADGMHIITRAGEFYFPTDAAKQVGAKYYYIDADTNKPQPMRKLELSSSQKILNELGVAECATPHTSHDFPPIR